MASGKTTVGREVARRLGYGFLDTGVMYRAATLLAIRRGLDFDDAPALTQMAKAMDIRLLQSDGGDRLIVDCEDVTDYLRTPSVNRAVAPVSTVQGVRRALVPQQRKVAQRLKYVLVGRDIGTVVLPDARTKVYLEASAEVRAGRRYEELAAAGRDVRREQVLRDISRRDGIDTGREDSPLVAASDAEVIHTDYLPICEVVRRIVELAESRQIDGLDRLGR